MSNFDRGFIKWQPFESLVSSKQVINNLVWEKSKIAKPILSEEEIAILEEKIIDAYYSKETIMLSYYQNGFIKKIKGKIIKIDHIYKMIYLSSHLKIFFNQIIDITFAPSN